MGMADIQTKRKIFILGACGILLIVVTLSVPSTIVNSLAKSPVHAHESVIRSACAATLYPDLCFSTVKGATTAASSYVKSPKDVLLTALNYTINAVEHNYVTVKKLAAGRNLTPGQKMALDICVKMADDTLDELRKSEAELKGYGFKNYTIRQRKRYLMTLLSAAQTNQDTCLDGFSHNKDENKVRKGLLAGHRHLFRLLSNVLALIKNISHTELAALSSSSSFAAADSSSQPELRLGKDNWPEWLSDGDRRLLQATTVTHDVVVAADGSGNYRTIAEAVAAAPSDRDCKNRYVIKIKAGKYRENVTIPKNKTYLMFVGDSRLNTTITAKMNMVDGIKTFYTATFAVEGEGFLARDITFDNGAGWKKEQAVALRVNADVCAFYRCGMQGYQDTLYVHSLRQFYTNCVIVGSIDFIFGNAEVHIQDSQIHARLAGPDQKNMVTAQSRNDSNQVTGIIIQSCRINATKDLYKERDSVETYLGRPWGDYSRTVIMQTEITDVIHPEGWHEWDDVSDYKKDQVYYAEYRNTGSGADTSHRVKWGGVKPQISEEEAEQFTAENFIDAMKWLPDTGFPFIAGLE